MPIQNINHNTVYLKDNSYVKILEVEPINFELKSEFEQEAILMSYKKFLKSCNFDIQIVIQSQVTDISQYLNKVKRLRNEDDNILKEMADDYIDFTLQIINSKRNVSKKFYIVIKGSENIEENISKVRDGLKACGNIVNECTSEEIIIIMKNCFNRRIRGLERNKV